MSLSFTMTPRSINILLDNRMRTVDQSHVNFAAVKAAIINYQRRGAIKDLEDIRDLINIPNFIAKVTEGRVQVSDSEVRFDGQPTHTYIATRLLQMLTEGFDIRPLARFMDRLDRNPHVLTGVKDELYRWLEKGGMPLAEDGCFFAWKRVAEDFGSFSLGPGGERTMNIPGTRVDFPRERLNPAERGQTCSSSGLHWCSYGYLTHYQTGAGNKVVIVKVAPEDVWSISRTEDCKGQAIGYWVIDVVPDDEVQHFFHNAPVSFVDKEQGDETGYDAADLHEDEDADGECGAGLLARDPSFDDEPPRAARNQAPIAEVKDRIFMRLRKQFKERTGHSLFEVRKSVAKNGVRAVARDTGIPRTTLRRYLDQIE